MDRASQVLAVDLPDGIPDTYAARAAHGDVPISTLNHRALGRRSREAKAQSQRYLTPYEENAVVEFLLQQKAFGRPVRMKHIPSIAFSATRNRPPADRPLKPPGPNWPKAFEKHHPELVAKKNRPQDWNRYNIYDKVKYWFDIIGEQLKNPAIQPENVYNMDEIGIMLSMLNSVKVLVGKNDTQAYRGARVKRTMVTAVECISADGRCLNPMIIWPAKTHRANWTTYPTPGWVYAFLILDLPTPTLACSGSSLYLIHRLNNVLMTNHAYLYGMVLEHTRLSRSWNFVLKTTSFFAACLLIPPISSSPVMSESSGP
jgi:hypothetical protein